MGVTSGVAHFFESIGEMLQGILAAIVATFKFVLGSMVDVFKGFANFVEGTLGFAFHNFFILGTLAAVVLGYKLYTQQQRRGTAGTIKS
ncbi:hypothetical protein GQX73_g7271 [Xylaria multiplex]|uniref:Uncharacterized protein n=1 Tax=Xylaria multiplex TaxID=323545 RepID=A0A7C8IQ98_9PEZI|nr:hypothetical protein GQX73_g7271 [Xylaria multiplex]